MGKNRNINSATSSISNTVLHEIVYNYTNRPNSRGHLFKESVEYRGQSNKKILKISFTESDLIKIKQKCLEKIKNDLSKKYPDIKVPDSKIREKLKEEMQYFFND